MSDPGTAQLLTGLTLGAVVAVLAVKGGRDPVARRDLHYAHADGTQRQIAAGSVIPKADVDAGRVPQGSYDYKHRSWLGAILAGADHRASTSKTVVFLWTLTVAYGLLALLWAWILGDSGPWDSQVSLGLQEEYLLLLGGPFAAAVLAKYAALGQAETKTDGPVGSASATQLISNDQGGTDIGDFQYLLFNLIGLAFFFTAFIGNLTDGFPTLPPLLTGLILTSTGGYAAKKLISSVAPTLTSVLPAAAPPGQHVQVFGSNLVVPASATDGKPALPIVLIGSRQASIEAHGVILGNDRLTVRVPDDEEAGSAPISATRADGVPARGPSGMNVLSFEVLSKPVQRSS